VLALRGGGRLDQELAAAAVIDFASPSTTLVRVSLLQAVAVDAGGGADRQRAGGRTPLRAVSRGRAGMGTDRRG
jgi:hypothetical protein